MSRRVEREEEDSSIFGKILKGVLVGAVVGAGVFLGYQVCYLDYFSFSLNFIN